MNTVSKRSIYRQVGFENSLTKEIFISFGDNAQAPVSADGSTWSVKWDHLVHEVTTVSNFADATTPPTFPTSQP